MLRRLLILVLLVGLGVGGGLWVVSRSRSVEAPSTPSASAGDVARLGVRLAKAAGGGPVRLGERDLRSLLLIGLERHPDGAQILAITREARARVDEGRLELGLVINLSAADEAELDSEQREVLDRLRSAVPFLEGRDLYLAVSGVPRADGGALSLAEQAKIKISFLNLSVRGVSELLSLEPAEVRQALVIELPVAVRQAWVEERDLLLEISPG